MANCVQLAGESGDRFELKVVGYQFPTIEGDDYSDWVNVQVNVANRSGSWSATDPSLLTTEVAELADWLEAISEEQETETELDFIEPNLTFELVEQGHDRIRLRVWFELELRPSWAPSNQVPERDICADLDVPRSELRAASLSLQAQLERFPIRANPPGWGNWR